MNWWNSIDILSRLQTGLAIVVTLLGIATLTLKLRSDHLKRLVDTVRGEERKRLDHDLQEKTREALQATAALAVRQAPRHLNDQQRELVHELLLESPKGKIVVQADWTDAEAQKFAGQVKSILEQAGFEIVPVTLQVLALRAQGAFMFFRDRFNPPAHARSIQQAFTTVGIELPADVAPEGMLRCAPSEIQDWSLEPDTLVIWIAAKP